MNAAGPDAAHLAAELNARIAQLARDLVGEPNEKHSSSQQLRFGSKGSLAVEIAEPKTGQWYDHEADVGGDGLELIRHHYGMSRSEALAWAREWLGRPALPPVQPLSPRDDVKEDRAAKVRAIVSATLSIEGSPAEVYLRNRGITATPSECIRFRANAWSGNGALAALATDAAGNVVAVQQVFLSPNGSKADLHVPKRTNGRVKGAAVRLPGDKPVILCEGVEDALSVWQATGRETWACLGVSHIGDAPLTDGAPVVVAGDNDEPGTSAEAQLDKAIHRLVARGHSVSVVKPHEVKDFNDLLLAEGEEALRETIRRAERVRPIPDKPQKELESGSDVEIAGNLREELVQAYGHPVHAEGAFWRFGTTQWEEIPPDEMRQIVHRYDGLTSYTASGKPTRVRLGKSRIDSILNECAAICATPGFFDVRPTGINCAGLHQLRSGRRTQPRASPSGPSVPAYAARLLDTGLQRRAA